MRVEDSKTVYKPWGKEVWLELNEKYCYKRIYIDKGHRTSYQYHNYKRETNFLISGKAEVWLENDEGVVEKFIMNPGEFFNVTPPKKHRVIALTDIILQEVSTPEVDDVIRLEDDTNRINGRLDHEHQSPALCILAAGKGERMGELTKKYHKGLLPVNNKSIISHMIDKVPSDYSIVIAVGFNSSYIVDYCESAHPNRDIKFVYVDDIDSNNSGPGYSLKCCKEHLQRPFYITTADCLIKGDLPSLDSNWIGTQLTGIPELYSTAKVDNNGIVTDLKNKSEYGYDNAFIGLCGIYDFDLFWREFKNDGELVSAFYNIKPYNMKSKQLDWYDIGNIDGYIKAKKDFEKEKLGIDKLNNEYVYKVGDKFIKHITDNRKCADICDRAKNLKGIVPDTTNNNHFISYDWVNGDTLYNINDIVVFRDFLGWCTSNMWEHTEVDITNECQKFYKEKTLLRYKTFMGSRDVSYSGEFNINGIDCESILTLIDKIDWNEFNSKFTTKKFHGDLQFDNVIYDGNNFSLIDWRSDFGGYHIGDVYYDLAKLYGGILMSYKDMKDDDNIDLEIKDKKVIFNYKLPKSLNQFRNYYEEWVINKGYNINKIKKITALIYLNMSPLHSNKFGDMLFFKSISMINELYK